MQVANVTVVLSSAIVYPSVAYLTFRSLLTPNPHSDGWLNEHKTTSLGPSAILIISIIALYAAGFYAAPPFDDVSRFSSMFLSSMLIIKIAIERRKVFGYVIAGIFAVLIVIAAFATIAVHLRF